MTILGYHSIAELADLVNATDYKVQQVKAGIESMSAAELALDPTLVPDWFLFLQRWTIAKGHAKQQVTIDMIANPLVPADGVPDEAEYKRVLFAISPTDPLYTDKDFPGLVQRVNKIRPMNFKDMPKGTAGDIDLSAYKGASKATSALNSLKDDATHATDDWLSNNWGKLLFGGIAAGATLMFINKVEDKVIK